MPNYAILARRCASVFIPAALAIALPLSAVHAESAVEQGHSYSDAAEGNQRINLSGRLRMLGERISGMSCNYAAGINAEQSYANLQLAVEEYAKILNGLQHGEPALGIHTPEENLRILHGLDQVHTQWAPVSELANAVMTGETAESSLIALDENTATLLTDVQSLVVHVVQHHYDRVNTIQSESLTIDFAGRQRMLAQRMSKNICLIHLDTDAQVAAEGLSSAHAAFDGTLTALQFGMPQLGVSAPPNEDVLEGLKVVATAWAKIAPQIQQAIDGERFDPETRTQIMHDLDDLTAKMNAAVQMYVAVTDARKS